MLFPNPPSRPSLSAVFSVASAKISRGCFNTALPSIAANGLDRRSITDDHSRFRKQKKARAPTESFPLGRFSCPRCRNAFYAFLAMPDIGESSNRCCTSAESCRGPFFSIRCRRPRPKWLSFVPLRSFEARNIPSRHSGSGEHWRQPRDVCALEGIDHRLESRFQFPHFVADRDVIDAQILAFHLVGWFRSGPSPKIDSIGIPKSGCPKLTKPEFVLLQLFCGRRIRDSPGNKRLGSFRDQISRENGLGRLSRELVRFRQKLWNFLRLRRR
jgi:hypothetical protein